VYTVTSFWICAHIHCLFEHAHSIKHALSLSLSLFRAKQGHLKAMYATAMMYSHGRGTGMDDKAAAKWFRKAAENGMAPAQYR